jgi:hypothetical protein
MVEAPHNIGAFNDQVALLSNRTGRATEKYVAHLHAAFDRYLVTINPNSQVIWSNTLKKRDRLADSAFASD